MRRPYWRFGEALRYDRRRMRVLGVDLGRRRVGLAISDVSGTLARPLGTLTVENAEDAVSRVAAEVGRLSREEDGLAAVVVGLPRRLDGTPNEQTELTQTFVAALGHRIDMPIACEDERLTSREAESRLALRERDWRKRRRSIDAAAAAIILQDYLDRVRQSS